ncbi:MAG TPA: hypothetical protein VJM11_00425 [Nevskiaceae bacterium]|nr:hypothetical protein [Nevskiaceae bacterium]
MSVTAESFALSAAPLTKETSEGPVTRAHLRRARLLHAACCAIGLLPWLLDASAGLQAAGWGLWLPGAGFLALGGWQVVLFPVTLLLFGLAFFAWFGSGMIVAPVIVWGGAALVAGLIAGTQAASYAPVAVPLVTVGWLAFSAFRRAQKRREQVARRDVRNAYLPGEVAEIRRVATAAPARETRALDERQLGLLRYVLDRSLQPVGTLHGFDRIDQFQTSALRYQLNQAGWALGIAQRHYTPNFHGYVAEGQRRVIEQYLQRPIWSYWKYEHAWGHLGIDFDPAKQDNIMLTGYLNINTLLYQNNTGDGRYAQPGALTFAWDAKRKFVHDTHSIHASLMDNYRGQVYRQPYCLFPCEPNWIYTSCNFRGFTCVTLHDTVFGTRDADEIRATFRQRLEEEFINLDAGMVALRSKHTGHALPFPVPDAILVKMLNPLFPDLALRYWAIARREALTRKNGRLELVLEGKGVDFGNYKAGQIFACDAILGAAQEMGDAEAVEAAQRALDTVVGRVEQDGVAHWRASNMGNLMAMESSFGVTGGWREAICTRPPDAVLRGPILADAAYPDVLVARAISRGEDLDLLLHPGRAAGHEHALVVERLQPGRRYRVGGARAASESADAQGRLRLHVRLDGPTAVHVVPA